MALRRRKPIIHEDRIYLGRIVKPHALKGEVKFLPFGIDARSLETYGRVKMESPDRELEIESVRGSEKSPIIKFKSVDSFEHAKELSGISLWVEESELPGLEDDAYYESDFLFSRAVTVGGDDLGRIEEIIETGECDVLTVRNESGRELLIPANREIVKEIRREESIVVVDPPEEFLEPADA